MASCNRVTSTSLSLTLPISCQICLGKVKEPVVCPNQHVFCSPCLDLWLRSNHYCPTCRTPITHDQPCKKILGSIDLQVNSDSITKAELRRTRLELIRKEYEANPDLKPLIRDHPSEFGKDLFYSWFEKLGQTFERVFHPLSYLEDDLASMQSTIERLKVENKRLHERLSEQDKTISSLHLSVNQKGKEGGSSSKPCPDLDMLLKLTAKLQEASVTYEQLKNDMLKTKEDNKRLREENESLSRQTTRLKDDSLFTKSPQRFSRYSMAAMQTKVSQYEKEVQQLKKALKRSDNYIDELNAKIEVKSSDERPASSGESNPKPSSTNDESRRSSIASLEGLNTTTAAGSSPQNPTENNDADNNSSSGDEDRPTMVNVCNFPSSSALTSLSQNASNVGDVLSSPLAEAASAIEAADQWLKAAAGKADGSSSLQAPDVFYQTDTTPLQRLTDSKLNMNSAPVDPFPASRQLMMLSERLCRQRETSSVKLDYSASSPASSSDGGKVLPKTLDFDMLVEGGSVNGDSPRNTPRLDTLSPRIENSSSELTSVSAAASYVYAKIKTEGEEDSDPTAQAKKVKLEKDETFQFGD